MATAKTKPIEPVVKNENVNNEVTEEKVLSYITPVAKINFTTEPTSLHAKLQRIRVELSTYPLRKSGVNTFARYQYFQLQDFVPTVNYLLDKYNLTSVFTMNMETATLTIIDCDKPENTIVFATPVVDSEVKGCTPVQNLGSIHTYLKRYLYQNAFEISEPDALDALTKSDQTVTGSSAKTPLKTSVPPVPTPSVVGQSVKTETPVAPTPAINTTPMATTPVEPTPTPVEESPEVARAKIIRGAIAKKSKHMPEILKYIRETGAKPSLKDITEEQTKQILEFVKTIPDDVA